MAETTSQHSAARRSTGLSIFTLSFCAIAHTATGFHAPTGSLSGGGILAKTHRGCCSVSSSHSARPLFAKSLIKDRRGRAAVRFSMALLEPEDQSSSRGGPDNLVKDFVTQRSLQTLLWNLQVSHEGSKVEFLENFLEHQGITDFHGYGALRVGWKIYLQSLRKATPFDVVRSKTIRAGGSPGNPYLKDKVWEYTIRIDPTGLADDLFEIRKQLADEWSEDLTLISAENAELFRHHHEVIVNKEDSKLLQQHPLMQSKDSDSPLRKSNYDLLEKYVTHIATERVIHEMSRSRSQEHSHDWMRKYMQKNGKKFTGDHGKNVGRQFMTGLLNCPPSFVANKNDDLEEMNIVDPVDIAAKIMVERQCVAEKWISVLEGIEEDHLELHRKHMQDCFEAQIHMDLN